MPGLGALQGFQEESIANTDQVPLRAGHAGTEQRDPGQSFPSAGSCWGQHSLPQENRLGAGQAEERWGWSGWLCRGPSGGHALSRDKPHKTKKGQGPGEEGVGDWGKLGASGKEHHTNTTSCKAKFEPTEPHRAPWPWQGRGGEASLASLLLSVQLRPHLAAQSRADPATAQALSPWHHAQAMLQQNRSLCHAGAPS